MCIKYCRCRIKISSLKKLLIKTIVNHGTFYLSTTVFGPDVFQASKNSRMSNRSKSWHRGHHFWGTNWKNIGSIFIEQSHPLGNSRKTLGKILWTIETDKNTPPQIKNPESKGVKVLMLILLIAFFSVSSSGLMHPKWWLDESSIRITLATNHWVIFKKKICQKLTDPRVLGKMRVSFSNWWDMNSRRVLQVCNSCPASKSPL